MALPPVIANNPLVKLFRSEGVETKNSDKKTAAEAPAQTPRDVVEISEAARKKLESVKQKAAEDDVAARKVAVQTRDLLTQDESQTLGLDPEFAA
jgi:hypothetical protein